MKDSEVLARLFCDTGMTVRTAQSLPSEVRKKLGEFVIFSTLRGGSRRGEMFTECLYRKLRKEPEPYTLEEILATEITDEEYPHVKDNFIEMSAMALARWRERG